MAAPTRVLTTLGLFVLCLSAPVAAQQKQEAKRQVVDVKLEGFRSEGGVTNVVEGDATYSGGGSAPQPLTPRQEFQNNDVVVVGDRSRVEILLNPGTYLRLGSNSQLLFVDLSPDNLKLKLLKGSAVVEVLIRQFEGNSPSFGDVRDKFTTYQPITLLTPDAQFATATGGVYSCVVDSDGRGFLKVFKGVAVVLGDLIKEGTMTALGERVPVPRKFNAKEEDALELWSRKRGVALVALNKSLRNTEWHTKLRKNPNSYLSILYEEASERRKERLVVSAIGGLVAYAESGAAFKNDEADWQPLVKDAQLNYGDRVRTGSDSRVEIRVYPSCYLTLAENTEIIYGSADDGPPAIRVLQGSAIIASKVERAEGVAVSFLAGDSLIEIPEPGFYRLNVYPRRESDILVYDGKLTVDGTTIKSGQRAILFAPRLIVAHVRRMDLDAFELWSRKRSSLLFARTDLSRRQVIEPTLSTRRVSMTGMWYLDQTSGAYTFVPGSTEFSSPYGGRYSVGFEGRFHR
jgi:hypothetical protein